MQKSDIAKENFLSGLACSQAVALAFKDELNIDENTLKNLSLGFGGGFARQRLVCGAVSGMTMVISALVSEGKTKPEVYKILQDAYAEVKKELGSIICADLLGVTQPTTSFGTPEDRTPEYYKKRPCAEICEVCAKVAEKYVNLYK